MPDDLFAPLFMSEPTGLVLVRDRTDDVLASSDVVIGIGHGDDPVRVARETDGRGLHGVSPLTYRLGQAIRAGRYVRDAQPRGRRRIVPELIQDDFTPERTAAEAVALLTDATKRRKWWQRWPRCRQLLGHLVPLRAQAIRCSRSR